MDINGDGSIDCNEFLSYFVIRALMQKTTKRLDNKQYGSLLFDVKAGFQEVFVGAVQEFMRLYGLN